jgi:hypothetical protein
MAENTRDDQSAVDSVIVIEPPDILPQGKTPDPLSEEDSGEARPWPAPNGASATPSEDDVGWDSAAHWHRAVPATSDDPDPEGDPAPEQVAEPVAELVAEPAALASPEPTVKTDPVASQKATLAGGQDRWREILSGFVDDPHGSVEAAAALADQEVAALSARLSQRQDVLRGAWQGADRGTEDFRMALKAYRDFCMQLGAFGEAGRAG